MAPSPEEQQAQDEMLMSLAAKLGGIDPLLRVFFSFLHRKTDFYVQFSKEDAPKGFQPKMGFPSGQAEAMVARAFKSFPMKDYNKELKRMEEAQAQYRPPVPKLKPTKPAKTKAKQTEPSSSGSAGSKASSSSSATSTLPPPRPASKAATSSPPPPQNGAELGSGESNPPPKAATNGAAAAAPQMPTVRMTERGKQMPIGNGGVTANYYWTQTLYELTAFVYVPKGTRGAGLACTISPNRIELKLKTPCTGFGDKEGWLLRGDMPQTCRPDESMWMVEDDPAGEYSIVQVNLDKIQRTWWDSVVKGDPEIDTQQVDSTCKIDEYDAETQGSIRKIMFDQKQKAKGLPTSEEIEQEELMSQVRYLPGSPFLHELPDDDPRKYAPIPTKTKKGEEVADEHE